MSRRSESVRGLIPGQACSSCVKRRGPSERSWTISGVHFDPIRSAVAATEQLALWTSFMVRFRTDAVYSARSAVAIEREEIGLAVVRRAHYPFCSDARRSRPSPFDRRRRARAYFARSLAGDPLPAPPASR